MKESFLTDCTLKDTHFLECDLTGSEIDHTALKGIDLSTCQLAALRISPMDLKGALISEWQAIDLVGLLGVIIK